MIVHSTVVYIYSDVVECNNASACGIGAVCDDTPGSYTCSCPSGKYGDPNTQCCEYIHVYKYVYQITKVILYKAAAYSAITLFIPEEPKLRAWTPSRGVVAPSIRLLP